MADLESVELTCYTTLVNLTALPATCARSSRLRLQGASRFVPLKPDPKRRLDAAAIPSDERRRVPSSSSRTASRFLAVRWIPIPLSEEPSTETGAC